MGEFLDVKSARPFKLERLKKWYNHFGARIFELWRGFGEGAGLNNPVTEPKRSQSSKKPLSLSTLSNGYNIFENALTLGIFLAITLAFVSTAQSGPPQNLIVELGGGVFANWTGIQPEKQGIADWNVEANAIFKYPPGPRGWYRQGFRDLNDGSADWRSFYGVQLDVLVLQGRVIELQAAIAIPPMQSRQEYLPESHAALTVSGEGWQHVTLPWAIFDFEKGRSAFLQFISEFRLAGKFADGKGGAVKLRNVRLVRALGISLAAEIRGKSVQPGKTATYDVTVGNCTDSPQDVALSFEKFGWEAMAASVEPSHLKLAPRESAAVIVSVRLPKSGIPPGGHEQQQLLAASGLAPQQIEFITARDVAHPSIQLTPTGWEEVREKVKKYDWARREQERYVRAAETWGVPLAAVAPNNMSEGHVYSFLDESFRDLSGAAIAWQLTRNTNDAQKVALFLRRLADAKTGYGATFAGTSRGEPQEGGNFQGVAIAYDSIRDAGVLTDADRSSIEHMLRLYMETVEPSLTVGNIGNWSVAEDTSALFCALAMGDLAAANRYLYGASGFTDYISKGIMDDGWWWECSTHYNFWVASELTQYALACRPWGIDLLNQQFPADYSPRTIITPWALNPLYGMSFEKWGAVRHNTRSVKMMWDAVPIVADYRGIAFGMNDGHEEQVGGAPLELGYYAFHDPAYVPLLKLNGRHDLIYGVPELPEITAKPYLKSGVAENIGYALLRSQATNRAPRERIEAVFKIGTQGGYHGHFDRVSLNTMMRYGRSFWNPESVWWGYANFMYKFYVQTSVAHNMVVVDQKQQEAVPSSQLLLYFGKTMQVSAQETDARWSDPPYGGMQYGASDSGGAVKGFVAGMKRNRQSVPLATDRRQGELGPFSDRVLQRRLGIVTDDYVVIADYLKSEQPHTFDNLFQMKGFLGLDAPEKKFLRHDAQFNSDPHSSAQFITDCDWYQSAAPVVARFLVQDGTGEANQHNESGVLRVDVHCLWPPHEELMLAQPPESLGGQQWVKYEISADGKALTNGESGMWILGAANIDVPIAGAKELSLKLTTDGSEKKTLFLANARIISREGREVPLGAQPVCENIESPAKAGEDYYAGPIKIAGELCSKAIPAQPLDGKKPAVIRISLAGKGGMRFKAALGADYPFGDESSRRKIFASRVQGPEARFLTILEPYEKQPMVKFASAIDANTLHVELADGREQEIHIENLDASGTNIVVNLTELQDGKVKRRESSAEE
jgi:hypothetical protein